MRQAAYDPGSDPPGHEELPRCARIIRRRDEGVSRRRYAMGTGGESRPVPFSTRRDLSTPRTRCFEQKHSALKTALATTNKALLSRGLLECPTLGELWVMSICSEPRPKHKPRSVDMLKKSTDIPVIICTIAGAKRRRRSSGSGSRW